MKKKIIIISIAVGVLLILSAVLFGAYTSKEEPNKLQKALLVQYKNAEQMLMVIGASGTVVLDDNEVVIKDFEYDELVLIQRISAYNVKTLSRLKPDDIMEQVEVYMVNYEFVDGRTKELEEFYTFVMENKSGTGIIYTEID